MRWLASIAVLCLMAASGVRPARVELRHRAPANAAKLEAAKRLAGSDVIARARRSTAARSELRLHAFVIAPAPVLATPARSSWPSPAAATPRAAATLCLSCSARGPPVG